MDHLYRRAKFGGVLTLHANRVGAKRFDVSTQGRQNKPIVTKFGKYA